MKKIKSLYSLLLIAIIFASCSKNLKGISEDNAVTTTATGNVSKIFDITNDNSGIVRITPLGNSVTSFIVAFGHGAGASASATVLQGASTSHAYPEGSYTVTITAVDLVGNKTTSTYPLTVTYRAPENLAINKSISGNNVTLSATALYANSFLVYFGDVANEVGTPMAVGQTLPAHTYPGPGVYNLKVIAQSGGVATTTVIDPVTIFGPFGLPITFDNAGINYFFGTFGDGQQFSVVANPNASGINTSAKVGRFTRGDQGWSGTYSPLDLAIDFAQGKKIKVLVYNTNPALIGTKLNVELEAAVAGTGAPANGVAVLKTAFTTSGAWEELVFDYATISPTIPSTAQFKQLVLRFNDPVFGSGVGGNGTIVYVDNFRLTN
jgi:hypothetical protein